MFSGRESGRDGAVHFATKAVVRPLEMLAAPLGRREHEVCDRACGLLGVFQLPFALRGAVLVTRYVPPTLIATLRSHSAAFERASGTIGSTIPALFTRIVAGPTRRSVARTSSCT